MWFVFALLSAIFAALTSILAKIGIDGVNSNLATAVRTVVVVSLVQKISNENIYIADKRDEDVQKRLFRIRFTFKNKK